MTGPGPQQQPRAPIEEVLRDLETRRPLFKSLCKEFRKHIEKCLSDEQIVFQEVQTRVKSASKVKAKYSAKHKENRYKQLDDLTDIAGLRIVTYYEDKVDAIKSILEREFQIDWENSQDKRVPENPESFTYSALHLVVSLKPETLGARAHKKYTGLRAEIQITTSLRHAWAEIEHKWYDLWDAFPIKAKRRFARLSALIEMADQEFVSLRKEFEAGNESTGLLVAGDEDTPIDAQSLRAFIEREPLVLEIDRAIAERVGTEFRDEIPLNHAFLTGGTRENSSISSIGTIGNLRDTLFINREKLMELAGGQQSHPVEWTVCRGDCLNILSISLANGLLQPASRRSR